jgi:hypothetical protein
MKKIKLSVSDWFNGVWGNRVLFFKTLIDAKNESKKQKGKIKIYNEKNQLINSQNNEDDISYG